MFFFYTPSPISTGKCWWKVGQNLLIKKNIKRWRHLDIDKFQNFPLCFPWNLFLWYFVAKLKIWKFVMCQCQVEKSKYLEMIFWQFMFTVYNRRKTSPQKLGRCASCRVRSVWKSLGWVTFGSKKFGPKILAYLQYTFAKYTFGKCTLRK